MFARKKNHNFSLAGHNQGMYILPMTVPRVWAYKLDIVVKSCCDKFPLVFFENSANLWLEFRYD